MIWHIFKKDVRLFWHFAAVAALLAWLTLFVSHQASHDDRIPQMWSLLNLLLILHLLASGLLAAIAVHADAIPGMRQDWLVRPIERRDLLLAKLLFVAVMVIGPDFLGFTCKALLEDMPVSQILAQALWQNLCLLAAFYLPVMAFASITRNFAENIVAIVTAIAVLVSLKQSLDLLLPHAKMVDWTGLEWMGEYAVVCVAAIGAAAIVVWQYFRRRVVAARWLATIVGVLAVATDFTPWQPAFALQQRLSPHPGGASRVALEFRPELGRFRQWESGNLGGHTFIGFPQGAKLYLPLHVSGLGPGTVLRTDMVHGRTIDPDGKSQDLEPVIPPRILNEGESSPDGRTLYDLLYLPAVAFENLRATPVRLELDHSLTLLHLDHSFSIPAIDAHESVPGFGFLETRLDRAGTQVQVRGQMVPRTAPCMTLFLENAKTGSRNPEVTACNGQYGPFNLQLFSESRRAQFDLPIRDTAGQLQLPVDGSQLRDARVVMRFYTPVEHFTRRVAISNVHLGDWLPL
jgi:hypothetical protein